MKFDVEDVRIDTHSSGTIHHLKATHIPTSIVVNLTGINLYKLRIKALKELRKEVESL